MTPAPLRGDIWRTNLEPVLGREQGRVRPALIISNDIINRGPADLVTVVPITTTERPLRSFLQIHSAQSGLPKTSFIICDQIRTISRWRLGKRLGGVSDAVLAEVEQRLRFLLDFE